MSKWHNVYIVEQQCNLKEIGNFLHELNPKGRWKAKPFKKENKYYWCFKFKDKTAATGFKLRWT